MISSLGPCQCRCPDDEHPRLFVHRQADTQFQLSDRAHPGSHHLETYTIERIGSVGEQFPQKDFMVFVQGMDQNIEQLLGLSLE